MSKNIEESEVFKQAKEVPSSQIPLDKPMDDTDYNKRIEDDTEKIWMDKGVAAYDCYKFGKIHGKNKKFDESHRYISDINSLFEEYIKTLVLKNDKIDDKQETLVRIGEISDALKGIVSLLAHAGVKLEEDQIIALLCGYTIGIQQKKEYADD